MAGPGNIMIRVGADTAGAVREVNRLGPSLDDVNTRGQKMGAGVRKATLPAIAVLGGLAAAGISAGKAAAEDEAAQVKLAGALERTTGATAAQVAAAESYITKLSLATGIADDELRPALSKLAAATGSVAEGQGALGLALDIAAQSGKSVEVVSKALAGAYDGKTAALAKLVPGLDMATLKSKDMAKITEELAQKVGGAAVEAAGTATGKYRVMQVQLGELQEGIGAGLLPIIGKMTSLVLAATKAASEHTTAAKVVIGVIAGLAAGVLAARAAMALYQAGTVAVKVATAAWTAVQWLLNAALTANPIGLVVAAAALLAAGIVVLYLKSETFRSIIAKVWAVLKLSPLGQLIAHFDDLAGAIESVVNWISRIHFPSPPSWFGKIGGILGATAPGAASISARSSGAARGTASRPRGGPRGASPMGAGASGSGVVIQVFGATDPEGTARAIRRALKGHERRQGGLFRIAEAG